MTDKDPAKTIVFISYASEDFEYAERLYNELKKAGFNPWLDKKELLPGQNWEYELEIAIRKSRYFIPLFSNKSVNKTGHVQKEFKFALEVFKRYPPNTIFAIPVRLGDCEIPYSELKSIHHVNLFPLEDDAAWKEGINQILRTLYKEEGYSNIEKELFKKVLPPKQTNEHTSANILKNKGIALNFLHRFRDAIEWFDKSLKINPNDANTWIEKGWSLYNLHEYDKSIQCHNKAIDVDPTYGKPWNVKGLAFHYWGKYNEAIECYNKAIEMDPKDTASMIDKGVSLENLGKYNEAIECYNKAIDVDPTYIYAWNNKGILLYQMGQTQYEKALECFNHSIDIDPSSKTAWNYKGLILYSQKKYDEAIECYDVAIDIDNKDPIVWNNKGEIFSYSLKNYEEAINCFDKSIEADPNYIDAWNNKGYAFGSLEKYDEAIECYKKILDIEFNDVSAWYNIGHCFKLQSKYDEAINCFNRVNELDPHNIDAWNNKGECLYDLGKINYAEKCFRKASAIIDSKTPVLSYTKEYLDGLNSFSESIRQQFKDYDIPLRFFKPIEESIKDIVKEIGIFQKSNEFDDISKNKIYVKIITLVRQVIENTPRKKNTLDVFKPLLLFNKLIGPEKGLQQILESISADALGRKELSIFKSFELAKLMPMAAARLSDGRAQIWIARGTKYNCYL